MESSDKAEKPPGQDGDVTPVEQQPAPKPEEGVNQQPAPEPEEEQEQEEVREERLVTQTVHRKPLDKRLRGLAPINALYAEHIHKYIAYGVAVVSLMVSAGFIAWAFQVSKMQERFIALDGSNTFHIGHTSFNEIPLYQTTALLATQAHFQRSPIGLDLPELARSMYAASAYESLSRDVEAGQEDFEVRNLHQKPEISQIRAMREREGLRFIEVRGNLIRSGSFNRMAISESEPFAILFAIQRNPNLGQRGAYPYIVANYRIATIQ
jgi:hypothetical protein